MTIEIRDYFNTPTDNLIDLDEFIQKHPGLNKDTVKNDLARKGWHWVMCNPIIFSYWLVMKAE